MAAGGGRMEGGGEVEVQIKKIVIRQKESSERERKEIRNEILLTL